MALPFLLTSILERDDLKRYLGMFVALLQIIPEEDRTKLITLWDDLTPDQKKEVALLTRSNARKVIYG